MIELSVSVPKYGILPYESHISSIINCYTKENINLLCSMLNMKCIILEQRNTKQEYFDFLLDMICMFLN